MTTKAKTDTEPEAGVETMTEVPTERGRVHMTVHGSGLPSEPETKEQGEVRTGRTPPEHAPNEDSAGLTAEETRRRQEHTRAERDKIHALTQAQGEAAAGDAPEARKRTVPSENPKDEADPHGRGVRR